MKGQPTLVFLPGKSHGQWSLEGYSPWGHKELDMTERLTHTHTHTHTSSSTTVYKGLRKNILKREKEIRKHELNEMVSLSKK